MPVDACERWSAIWVREHSCLIRDANFFQAHEKTSHGGKTGRRSNARDRKKRAMPPTIEARLKSPNRMNHTEEILRERRVTIRLHRHHLAEYRQIKNTQNSRVARADDDGV